MTKLWLDDVRPAPDESWAVVRSYNEFVDFICVNPMPELISFDHDLGDGLSGYDCAMYLVLNDLDPPIEFHVHSVASVGSKNIRMLLENWAKHCAKRRDNKGG